MGSVDLTFRFVGAPYRRDHWGRAEPCLLNRARHVFGVFALLAVVGIGAPPRSDAAGLTADVTACLVKPRRVIQLGSPVFGVLAHVYVDRSDLVKKDQV